MFEKGKKINDRYEIDSVIGEGGMANVFLATDLILGRKVAVKVLRGDLATNEKFVRRFEREAVAASNLCHQNIVSIYDVLQEGNQHYIIMEYVEGQTLKQLIKKRGKLTLSEVSDIMLQLLNGITHAHEAYIIHRDIKPQNILILNNGLVKIADFGIAASLNESELTQTNSVMGSVYYLPPEQASGTLMTLKSDIYSLGIVMFELLTGKLPYKGENAVEIAMKHINDPLPSVRSINALIPQSIENIIIKATAKNVKNRYETAKEMKAALEHAINHKSENTQVIKHKYKESSIDSSTEVMAKLNTNDKEVLSSKEKSKKLENSFMLDVDVEPKNYNKLIISIIIIVLMILLGIGIFFMSGSDESSTTVVPDVSNMSIIEAENILKELGFEVALETVLVNSDSVEAGNVVKTEPISGRNIKIGTEITLYESMGNSKITLENYVGLNYTEVKAKLELLGLKVEIEYKDVEVSEYIGSENIIISQFPEELIEVNQNTTVYLFIPDIYDAYPNMVVEQWTEAEVRNWADDYKLSLTVDYEETTNANDVGIVLSQSREEGTKITSYATFKIVVGVLKEEVVEDDLLDEEADDLLDDEVSGEELGD